MAYAYNHLNNDFDGEIWLTPKSRQGTTPAVSGPITVTQDGVVQNSTGPAFGLLGGAYTLIVKGHVSSFATSSLGIFIDNDYTLGFPVGITSITVSDSGSISGGLLGSGGIGIVSEKSLSVINAGTIFGDLRGIEFRGIALETLSIVNTGTIRTSNTDAIAALGSGARTLTNSGSIFGSIFMQGGVQKISNSATGAIFGNLELDNGLDMITNAGQIQGSILTHGGNDVVTNSGQVYGIIDLSTGNNAFTNSGVVTGTAFTGASITADVGNDVVTNSGFVAGGIFLGEGNNTISNLLKGRVDGHVNVGNGNDKLTNAGHVQGDVDLLNGINSVTNSGTIAGNLLAGSGADTILNSGSIRFNVGLGDGSNKLTNSGTIGSFSGGNDADFVTNSKTISGGVDLYDGVNTLINSGRIAGDVLGGGGVDTITNSGTIDGELSTGAGNDIVKNTGTIDGTVELLTGNDSYTGGNFSDFVRDADGMDSYMLGGGDDYFSALKLNFMAVNDGLVDKVDGGLNSAVNFSQEIFGDFYSALNSTDQVLINADSVAHTNSEDSYILATLAKGTATGSQIGTDLILNFESFNGGTNNDLIWGNAAANGILGYDGLDHLHGGAGNDLIYGGLGSDRLSGDLGADELVGEEDSDSFVYRKLTDSTVAKTGQDTINDFEDGIDLLDFSALNTGNAFHLNTGDHTDAAFDGMAGAIRMLTNPDGWLLQLDSNGDKIVDLAIQIRDTDHSIVWDTTDFVL